jgi:rhodanese-related sulfurtransferase
METKRIRIAMGVAAAVAALTARAADGNEPFGMLTVDQVEKLLGQPNVVVVDANHEDLYRKSHLPGAVLMKEKEPLAKILPPDKGRTLVFYCASPS